MNDQSVGGRAAVLAGGYVDVGGKKRGADLAKIFVQPRKSSRWNSNTKWRGNKANAELAADERFSKKKQKEE